MSLRDKKGGTTYSKERRLGYDLIISIVYMNSCCFVQPFMPPFKENRPTDVCKAVLMCSGRESNPYGHFCPQDFKSGVYTNFTTRAPFSKKTGQLSGRSYVPRTRVEPAHHFWHYPLKVACLPFHHLGIKSLPKNERHTSNYENF